MAAALWGRHGHAAGRAIDRAGLREQIDTLAATYEVKPQWAVDQIDPRKADAIPSTKGTLGGA